MTKELMNLFMFLAICFLAYILFRGLNFDSTQLKEGMTNAQGTAGNALTYASTIKAETVRLQDTFLISKYRKDYENTILNLDDYINVLMLKTATSIDTNNPEPAIIKLSEMNNAKAALNNIMKFVDASK